MIQDLALRVPEVLDVTLGVARQHAQLVLGARLLEIVDPEGSLAVDNVFLDGGFAAAEFSDHHVEVANVLPRRHIPRRPPAVVVGVAEGKSLFIASEISPSDFRSQSISENCEIKCM